MRFYSVIRGNILHLNNSTIDFRLYELNLNAFFRTFLISLIFVAVCGSQIITAYSRIGQMIDLRTEGKCGKLQRAPKKRAYEGILLPQSQYALSKKDY